MTLQAQSSAPFVGLLRLVERCWKERQFLSDGLVERLREQLEGPLGVKAKADEAVLEAMEAFSLGELEQLSLCGTCQRETALLEALATAEVRRRGLPETL